MKLRYTWVSGGFALAALLSLVKAPEAPAQTKKVILSDQTFKNVQALKGIPVDDFIGTMGIMSASLGSDCSDCHNNAGTDKVDWADDSNPRKVRARKMVFMVQNINKQNFGGAVVVTCWTCHRGRDHPATVPALEAVYGAGPLELEDTVTQAPGQPAPEAVIDKYIAAIGGLQKVNAITSYVGKGTSVGFGGFGGGGEVTVYAKAPNQHTMLIEFKNAPGRGDSTRSYNGTVGWIKTPLTVLGEYELTGGELEGAKLDAQLAFPGQIKTALRNFHTGVPITINDLPGPESQTGDLSNATVMKERLVTAVQGTSPTGIVANLYFDNQTGLLLRVVRFSKSPIGRVPTQVDYADYRDVNGVKMPFRITFAWLDGRDAIQLNSIQANVSIDAARFGKPSTVH